MQSGGLNASGNEHHVFGELQLLLAAREAQLSRAAARLSELETSVAQLSEAKTGMWVAA
jgi:hypothetical protein